MICDQDLRYRPWSRGEGEWRIERGKKGGGWGEEGGTASGTGARQWFITWLRLIFEGGVPIWPPCFRERGES